MSKVPLPCPFCGTPPRIERGKKGHCSLHGDPFQPIVVRCVNSSCAAQPTVEHGDVYNGGEAQARVAAIVQWNARQLPNDLDIQSMPHDPSGEMMLAGQAAISDMGKVLTGAEIGAVWRAMWEANEACHMMPNS